MKTTHEMKELARDYHEGIQHIKENIPEDIREMKITKALDALETQALEEQKEMLAAPITREEVEEALKATDSNSAAGLDGITYELWKTLALSFKEDSAGNIPSFDVIDLLTLLFNDIEEFGIVEGTGFTDGWMCPIYKKNENTEISNYRPVTLLNTDYKLLTKILTMRLSTIAVNLIHQSQAGFVPGRQIADHAKLVRLLMQFAETKNQNGLIIALDQEKAYDKIDHAYLWQVLEQFNLPEKFIVIVKNLY